MKRVILLLFYLLFSLAILYASTVSFVVPSNIKTYSYDKAVNSSIPENRVVTINLTSSDVIYFTDSAGNEFSSKIFKTKKKAVDASFSWNINDENLRYSLDGSEPIEINDNKVLLSNFKTNNLSIFTIEAQGNDDSWNERGRVGFLPVKVIKDKKISLRVTASPYSIAIYDFIYGHNIKDAKYLTVTNYGYSIDSELGYQISKKALLYLGGGYGYQMKKETVIPYAFKVTYFKAYGGFDYKFLNKNKVTSSIGIFAGALMGINANVYSISSLLGARLRLDIIINSHLSFGLQTRFTASYSKAEDKYYTSMSYFIDPIAFSTDIRF